MTQGRGGEIAAPAHKLDRINRCILCQQVAFDAARQRDHFAYGQARAEHQLSGRGNVSTHDNGAVAIPNDLNFVAAELDDIKLPLAVIQFHDQASGRVSNGLFQLINRQIGGGMAAQNTQINGAVHIDHRLDRSIADPDDGRANAISGLQGEISMRQRDRHKGCQHDGSEPENSRFHSSHLLQRVFNGRAFCVGPLMPRGFVDDTDGIKDDLYIGAERHVVPVIAVIARP